eukprot:gene18202-24645_t
MQQNRNRRVLLDLDTGRSPTESMRDSQRQHELALYRLYVMDVARASSTQQPGQPSSTAVASGPSTSWVQQVGSSLSDAVSQAAQVSTSWAHSVYAAFSPTPSASVSQEGGPIPPASVSQEGGPPSSVDTAVPGGAGGEREKCRGRGASAGGSGSSAAAVGASAAESGSSDKAAQVAVSVAIGGLVLYALYAERVAISAAAKRRWATVKNLAMELTTMGLTLTPSQTAHIQRR